jgi:hypothetical protein
VVEPELDAGPCVVVNGETEHTAGTSVSRARGTGRGRTLSRADAIAQAPRRSWSAHERPPSAPSAPGRELYDRAMSQVSQLADTGTGAQVFETDLTLPGRGRARSETCTSSRGGRKPARLLIVATDRISAFDVVMPTADPGKGRLLTRSRHSGSGSFRSAAWRDAPALDQRRGHPRFGLQIGNITRGSRGPSHHREALPRHPVECVVRGYLEGSGGRTTSRRARSAA